MSNSEHLKNLYLLCVHRLREICHFQFCLATFIIFSSFPIHKKLDFIMYNLMVWFYCAYSQNMYGYRESVSILLFPCKIGRSFVANKGISSILFRTYNACFTMLHNYIYCIHGSCFLEMMKIYYFKSLHINMCILPCTYYVKFDSNNALGYWNNKYTN